MIGHFTGARRWAAFRTPEAGILASNWGLSQAQQGAGALPAVSRARRHGNANTG